MGTAQFDNQIYANQQEIQRLQAEINDLEAKIRDLRGFQGGLEQYKKQVQSLSSELVRFFSDPVSSLGSLLRNVKRTFFHSVSNAAAGSEYQTAVSHIVSTINAARRKEEELSRRITQCRQRIAELESQINTLRRQKQQYLAEEARKAAEEARKAAEAAANASV